jgi:HAD superfamily hydrolase (TIGR01662 family)
MLVYRSHRWSVRTDVELRALVRRFELVGAAPPHPAIVSLLVDHGILETALADALCPDVDELLPPLQPLRLAAVALGRALAASWRASAVEAGTWLHRAGVELGRVNPAPLPQRLVCSVPEGFAYYSLHPECYLLAAERFASARPPGRAVCLGLRTIGAPLAGVVAAALMRRGWNIERYTVRPRGHVFDRSLALGPSLTARVAAAEWCLIVDEGPGLSGSSFAGAAATAMQLGVPAERVVLFPSWPTDGSRFRNDAARRLWPLVSRSTASADELMLPRRLAAAVGEAAVHDLSAGRWRSVLLPRRRWPAVQPQHERAKYLVRGQPDRLFRFAGLGRFGEARRVRAAWLASEGMTPRPRELVHGYLATEWIDPPGQPDRCAIPSPAWIARYLALLDRQPDVAPGTTPQELITVATYNIRMALGDCWAERGAAALRVASSLLDARAVPHDGRMLPEEWITAADGPTWKTDALDHHDDHFYPGPANVAWDLAGAEIELRFSSEARDEMLARYARASGDTDAARRFPAFRVVYLAARLGYSTFAAQETAGTVEATRFHRLSRRYRRALRDAITALHPASTRAGGRPAAAHWDLLIFDADDTLRRTTVPGRPCPYAPGEWKLLPQVRRRFRGLLAAEPGLRLGIASNQDRVGYGRIAEDTARTLLHDLARASFGRELPPDAVQLCPHVPAAGCRCRKPGGAMLERIMTYYGISPERTLFVGDAETDRGAAQQAGTAFMPAAAFFSSTAASSPRRSRRMPPLIAADSCDAGEDRASPG